MDLTSTPLGHRIEANKGRGGNCGKAAISSPSSKSKLSDNEQLASRGGKSR
jgi:hypothetical protein